jgi:hypothetical protein
MFVVVDVDITAQIEVATDSPEFQSPDSIAWKCRLLGRI